MGIAEGEEWEPLAGHRRQCPARRRGADRAIADRPRKARPLVSAASPSPPSPPRRATSNRPRPRSAASCSTSPSRRRSARRPHRHHLARRHRLDQPRRLGEPARPVQAARNARCFRRGKDCVRAKMVGDKQGPAYRARHRREQSVPDARGARPGRRPVRRAAVPDRHALRPVHRPRPRCLNYACYQDARFLLVATPSGITLGPEGGAHQSINPPLIALGQPGLRHYEPAFADELAAMMEEAFRLIDDPDGESHLPPPLDPLDPPGRARRRRLERRRAEGRLLAARARPERRSRDRRDGRGHARSARRMGGAQRRHPRPRPAQRHLARPAPPRLDRGAGRRAGSGEREAQPRRELALAASRPAPASSPSPTPRPPPCRWLGGVLGQRVAPLGVERFGQTGNLADLYAAYRLDGAAITEAAAEFAPVRITDPLIYRFAPNGGAMGPFSGNSIRAPAHLRQAQAACDAIQAEHRPSEARTLDPPRSAAASAALISTDDEPRSRLAGEELEYARRMLDAMGDELSPTGSSCAMRSRFRRSTSSARCSAISPRSSAQPTRSARSSASACAS